MTASGTPTDRPPDNANPTQKAKWSIRRTLRENPNGLVFRELVARVRADWPGEFLGRPGYAIVSSARHAMAEAGEIIGNPGGHWMLSVETSSESVPASAWRSGGEPDSYSPIAAAFVGESLCTCALPLGTVLHRQRHRNPDVIGSVLPSARLRLMGYPVEVVAAEVKDESGQRVLAEGLAQANAYKQDVHQSYLVVPKEVNPRDLGQLATNCQKNGVGLCLFEWVSEEEVSLDIRLPAVSGRPNMERLEGFLERLGKERRRELGLPD